MATVYHSPFWTEDTVAAATLAATGSAAFQNRLDALATKWNIPALYALVQWWPMLLIIAGLILLLVHPRAEAAVPTSSAQEHTEIHHESHT
jgi:hypothetical protein